MRSESQVLGSLGGATRYLRVPMKTNPSLDFPRAGAGSLRSSKTTGKAPDSNKICSEWNYGNGDEALQLRELQWPRVHMRLGNSGTKQRPRLAG